MVKSEFLHRRFAPGTGDNGVEIVFAGARFCVSKMSRESNMQRKQEKLVWS
jgi:ribosomal protein L24E